MQQGRFRKRNTSILSSCSELQFSVFKSERKKCLQFTIHPEQRQLYIIKISNNIIPLIMLISTYISKISPNIPDNIFQNINIYNIPDQFQQFYHPRTMTDILQIFEKKAIKVTEISYIISNFVIVEFTLNCLIRKVLLDFIQKNQNLELMGNQKQLLQDYQVQLRGNILNLLSLYLGIQVSIKFGEYTSENYGSEQNAYKLQIIILQQHCQWIIKNDMKELKKIIKPQLIQVQSARILHKLDSRKLNSSIFMDTTSSMQSIDKVIRNSAKKFNPEILNKYEPVMNIAKYISPKNQKIYTQLNIQSPKIGYRKQKHKFCFSCRKVKCECQE